MKKTLHAFACTLLFLLLTTHLGAQSPVKLGAYLGLGYSNAGFGEQSKPSTFGGHIASSIGGTVEWMPGKLGIRSGLSLFQHALRMKHTEFNWIINGPPDPVLPESQRGTFRHFFLELPVQARYEINSKVKVNFGPSFQ